MYANCVLMLKPTSLANRIGKVYVGVISIFHTIECAFCRFFLSFYATVNVISFIRMIKREKNGKELESEKLFLALKIASFRSSSQSKAIELNSSRRDDWNNIKIVCIYWILFLHLHFCRRFRRISWTIQLRHR